MEDRQPTALLCFQASEVTNLLVVKLRSNDIIILFPEKILLTNNIDSSFAPREFGSEKYHNYRSSFAGHNGNLLPICVLIPMRPLPNNGFP